MIKKCITAVLASFLFLSVVQPFIASTNFDTSLPLTLFIIACVVVSTFIKPFWLQWILNFFFLCLMVKSYVNLDDLPLIPWISTFLIYAVSTLEDLFSGQIMLIPFDFGLFLIGSAIAFLTSYTLRYKKAKVAFAVFLLFFLCLNVLNKSLIIEPMIQLISASLLLSLWYQYEDTQTLPWKAGILATTLIMFAAVSSLYFNRLYRPFHTAITTQTILYRSDLSQRGFYQHFNLNRVTGMAAHSGFSENDTSLGGPLYTNSKLIYEVRQSTPSYWKMDVKYNYIGTGWSHYHASQSQYNLPELPDIEEPLMSYAAESESYEILRSFSEIAFIPLPQGKLDVAQSDITTANIFISDFIIPPLIDFDPELGPISYNPYEYPGISSIDRIENRSVQPDTLNGTQFVSYAKEYTEDALRQASFPSTPYPQEALQTHTTTPDRVAELARSLTDSESNQYDKVIKIQEYLHDSDNFTYSTSDVPFLPENADFADHFLFDSKTGYCEHFSTAMVMLLRYADIPARWVKGYTSGTKVNGESDVYQIRNSDAHAWVEVYFAGYGWIPFEATPSFDMNENHPAPADDAISNTDTPSETPAPSDPSNNTGDTAPNNQTETPDTPQTDTTSYTPYYISGGLFILACFILRHWLYRWWLIIRLSLTRPHSFMKTYQQFLRILEHAVVRDGGTDISTYLKNLPFPLEEDVYDLTRIYQEMYYGNRSDRPLSKSETIAFRNAIFSTPLKARNS